MQKSFNFSGKSPLQDYDALQDKHASFYFNSHPVKKHLKKLKKAIDMQPHHKELEAYSLRLTQKIQQANQDQDRTHIQPYQQTLKPVSLQKLQQIQRFFNDSHSKKLTHGLPPLKQGYCQPSQQVIKSKKVKSLIGTEPGDRAKGSLLSGDWVKKRERSNQSLQSKIKMQQARLSKVREVKHEQFVNFLKQKQDALKKKENQGIIA